MAANKKRGRNPHPLPVRSLYCASQGAWDIMKAMGMMRFAKKYFLWHYGAAVRDMWEIEKNFLWFLYHFFSLPLLAQTFFAPIYRIREENSRGFDIGARLSDFIITSLMRLVGMIVRIPMLIVGVTAEGILAILFIPAMLVWLMLPLLATGMIAASAVVLW